ncbi:MAG: GNAT family protein [Ignavibacteriales bacterium]|nr:GNAT family protein [Ignavibacteriales bacterium]
MQSELFDTDIMISRYYLEDVDRLYEAVRESVDEVSIWLPWCHPNYSKQEAVDYINFQMDAWDYGNEFSFKILDRKNGKLIGGVGLNQFIKEHKTVNLGYWIRSGYTGKGIATTAAILCAKFGFDEIGINRIEIIAAVENFASIKVAEKTGARKDCILRNRLLIHDKIYDAVLFSLIPEDFSNKIIS